MMDSLRSKLNEIRRLIDEDVYRKRVLLLCQQHEPKSFDEYSSSGSFRRLEKFESSTYSEVLKAVDLADNKPVVMKIMRALSRGVIKLLPSVATKGCQAYNDILNELVVTQALSQLHDGVILNGQPNALFRTHFFCLIQEIKVVTGNLSRTLAKSKRNRRHKVAPAAAQEDQLAASEQRVQSTLDSSTAESASDANRNSNTTTTSSTTAATKNNKNNNGAAGGASDGKDNNRARSQTLAGARISTDMAETAPYSNGQNDEAEPMPRRARDDELVNLGEEERMLMEALPHEYVISVMRHDGQPLWWMMSHKKLSAQQLTSVLVQVIVGLAIAENVYLYEHRDLHVSNILIKRTSSETIPFMLDGQRYVILSHGIKATIIDATFSRLTHNGKVYYRDLTSTLRAYGTKKTPTRMSLQNRSYRQMVLLTMNRWDEFTPKTNLIWLTYLCETLMKNEAMKGDSALMAEVRKIRDCTLKVKTTYDLLGCFPFQRTDQPVAWVERAPTGQPPPPPQQQQQQQAQQQAQPQDAAAADAWQPRGPPERMLP